MFLFFLFCIKCKIPQFVFTEGLISRKIEVESQTESEGGLFYYYLRVYVA